MSETTAQQTESSPPGVGSGQTPSTACPMAAMCKSMMVKPVPRSLAVLPGAALIVLGLVILIEPRVLVWLTGAALVVFGVALLAVGNFVRKLSANTRRV